jgi:hypothetical protein
MITLSSTSQMALGTIALPRPRVRELVNPLVRQAEQARSITGAHLQSPPAQHLHCASCGQCGASIVLIGLPAEHGIGPNSLRCAPRQFHVIHDPSPLRIIDKQLHRFNDAPSGFIDGAALRVATAHALH